MKNLPCVGLEQPTAGNNEDAQQAGCIRRLTPSVIRIVSALLRAAQSSQEQGGTNREYSVYWQIDFYKPRKKWHNRSLKQSTSLLKRYILNNGG